MAKFSKKVMGKEVGDAKVYAQPHTMDGKKLSNPNSAVTKEGNGLDKVNISVGNTFKKQPDIKTSGIKIRGTGAATKGVMARGPMG